MQLNIQSVKECDLRQNGKQMEVRPHYITRWPVQETCSMYSVPLLMRVTCTACCNVPPSADISETLKSRSQTSKDAEVKWRPNICRIFALPRRYAEFAAAIVGINETFPHEQMNRLLAVLQEEVTQKTGRYDSEKSSWVPQFGKQTKDCDQTCSGWKLDPAISFKVSWTQGPAPLSHKQLWCGEIKSSHYLYERSLIFHFIRWCPSSSSGRRTIRRSLKHSGSSWRVEVTSSLSRCLNSTLERLLGSTEIYCTINSYT